MIYAFYPPFAWHSTVGKSADGLMMVFVVGSFAALLKGILSSPSKKSLPWFVISGVILGCGSYIRPDYLLLPVFLGIASWAYTRSFFRSLLYLGIVQILALVVLFPWAYRNHSYCGRWIFTSSSVGATLITGLGEYHNPWNFGGMDSDRARQVRAGIRIGLGREGG